MMSAVESATAVSSSAVSAPLQYGPEESACQKRCVSKLASTSRFDPSYLTSAAGTLYFAAIVFSVPRTFSLAMPSLICCPSVEASAFR